jgi:hypothetical protein
VAARAVPKKSRVPAPRGRMVKLTPFSIALPAQFVFRVGLIKNPGRRRLDTICTPIFVARFFSFKAFGRPEARSPPHLCSATVGAPALFKAISAIRLKSITAIPRASAGRSRLFRRESPTPTHASDIALHRRYTMLGPKIEEDRHG